MTISDRPGNPGQPEVHAVAMETCDGNPTKVPLHDDRQAKLAGRRWPPVSDPDDHDEQEPGEAESAPAEDAPTPPAAAPTRGRVARVYTPSQKAEALELAAKDGPTAAHKQLGISRYSIYAWQRKAALAAQVDQIAAKHKEWNGKLEV